MNQKPAVGTGYANAAAAIIREQFARHGDRLSLQLGVVATVTPPTCTIRPLASDTDNTESYAYLKGNVPLVGDTVVYGQLGMGWVVLGTIAT